jgi:hypothetical protein
MEQTTMAIEQTENYTSGYTVMPLAGGIRWFAVLAPDGSLVSEHRTCASAVAKARRLNRKELEDV